MMKKPDIDKIYHILKEEVMNYKTPVVDLIEIQTEDPFKVLVATILSARTTDQITTKVVGKLFASVNGLDDLAKLSLAEIEKLIYPIGFYKNKAKYLIELPAAVKKNFNGQIPDSVDELIKLPGVGRKTANLVVAVAFKKPAICVDIHVHRIMNRLGYVETKNPFQTEMALRSKLPEKYWITINSIFVAFGQYLCRPLSPHCSKCKIINYCNQTGVNTKR